jgi:hypothetical protein
LAADKAGIAGEFLKSSSGGAEREIVNQFLVAACELAQGVGQGESDQEVRHGQQELLLASQPGGRCGLPHLGQWRFWQE